MTRTQVAMRRAAVLGGACLALALTEPAGADAATLTLSAEGVSQRSCASGLRDDAAVAQARLPSPGVAMVEARIAGEADDWDLAVYEANGRRAASSAYASGDEIAQGFAITERELIVQACREGGSDDGVTVTLETADLTEPAPRMQLVRVSVPSELAQARLLSLGLDLTEHGGPGYLEVVLHGPADAEALEAAGLDYEVVDPDLLASSMAARTTERRVLRGGGGSGWPSGRDTGTYRVLSDYSEEMQGLARRNKRLVRYFTLPFETYEGRKVEAIEVAPRVRRKDGRPTFLMMGIHHAREWPSAEHTLEFAYELIRGWKRGNRKVRRLMRRTRVVFVPIVNPDGFTVSREAGEGVADSGRDAPGGDETANLVIPYEYHRKNCRYSPPEDESAGGDCQQPSALFDNGILHFGVDPNRNYGGFWGGPGASAPGGAPPGEYAADYRGPGPFSEPETRNIKRLASARQVTGLITNHTFSNLILRPPGVQAVGRAPDEPVLKRLGRSMANENGYTNQFGWQLYDTTGTTEDWSYWSTGGLGYTFEIGPDAFHPSYDTVIAEYRGTTEAAAEGGGNRAAYLKMMRASSRPRLHGVIKGEAPGGAVLKITKRFKTSTSKVLDAGGEEGERRRFRERLVSKMRVPRSGRFAWHVNPSTRPLVDPRRKIPQPRPGQPSDPIAFSGAPGPGAIPCADFDTEDPTCWNDHPFFVPGGEGIDNGTATVSVTWAGGSDWDFKVFRDTDGDGSSEGETRVAGSSGNPPPETEQTTITRPQLRRGKYVVRVINYAAVDPYEGSIEFSKTPKPEIRLRNERWRLTCKARPGGRVLARERVLVERGGVARLDLSSACAG